MKTISASQALYHAPIHVIHVGGRYHLKNGYLLRPQVPIGPGGWSLNTIAHQTPYTGHDPNNPWSLGFWASFGLGAIYQLQDIAEEGWGHIILLQGSPNYVGYSGFAPLEQLVL